MRRLSPLLLTTSLLFACEGAVDDLAGGGGPGGGAAGFDANGCPTQRPSDGASCETDLLVCDYWEGLENPTNIDCDEITYSFRCEADSWVEYEYQCMCPDELPEDGTDCLGYQAMILPCSFTVSAQCGETSAGISCGANTGYLWEVSVDETCAL